MRNVYTEKKFNISKEIFSEMSDVKKKLEK
jgi:hypothetical protein